MRNSRWFSILFKNDLTSVEILKGLLWGFGIKLIKAINEKVKKKVTKFFGRFSEAGIQVKAKKLK